MCQIKRMGQTWNFFTCELTLTPPRPATHGPRPHADVIRWLDAPLRFRLSPRAARDRTALVAAAAARVHLSAFMVGMMLGSLFSAALVAAHHWHFVQLQGRRLAARAAREAGLLHVRCVRRHVLPRAGRSSATSTTRRYVLPLSPRSLF